MPSPYLPALKSALESLDAYILAEAEANTPVATNYFEDNLATIIDNYTTEFISGPVVYGARSSLNTVFTNGIIVPLYEYPSNIYTNTDYSNLIALKRQYPQVPMIVILNPSSGPGSSVDGNYTAAIQLLQGAGIKVFGYVGTGYNSSRTLTQVENDITTWNSFYPGIDGMFFDEMTYVWNTSNEAFYTSISNFTKVLVPYTIANPGSPFDSNYIYSNLFDIIVGWENSALPTDAQIHDATLNGSPPPTWIPNGTGAASWSEFRRALILNTQGSMISGAELSEIQEYFGWIFVTQSSDYSAMSNYLSNLFEAFDPGANALIPWMNVTGTPTTAAGYGMSVTGTGSVVQATSPTLTTPNIGVATGSSFNGITGLSTTTPSMDGSASYGSSTTAARADHVHPTDTSRAPTASPTFTGTITTALTAGLVKSSSGGVLSVDTNTYLTGNQTITLSGAVTGSGTTAITTSLTSTSVTAAVLTGYVSGSGTIAATDSILQAIQKLNGNIGLLSGSVIYQGTWNANTNTPTLVSGTGTKGYYYKVSVAGTTTIDGISQWNVGDTIIFDGTTWDKIDGLASEVSSVFGRVGAVIGAAADYSGVAMTGITSMNGLVVTANTGAVTTGTWNGSVVAGTYGGTGVNNGSSTITIGGNVAFSGAYTFTGALTANTSVTFPTSGTLISTTTLPIYTSGSASVGALAYNGTTQSAGKLDGGTTDPAHTTRLNYDGNFHANTIYSVSASLYLAGQQFSLDNLGTSMSVTFSNTSGISTFNGSFNGTTNVAFPKSGTLLSTSGAYISSTPSNPTGTSSASLVMMGLNQTIAPANSTRLMTIISGTVYGDTSGGLAHILTRIGTGSAPSNGAGLTGTSLSSIIVASFPVANETKPFCLSGIQTGLTVGTTYWIDIALASPGAGSCYLESLSVSVYEI